MKQWLLLSFFLSNLIFTSLGQTIVPIYEGPVPGSENQTWKQQEQTRPDGSGVFYNVTQPSMEVYQPEPDKANGTAIVIAPGGAFYFLSISSEGRDVAKWLTAKGVTCFILRYRLARIFSDDPIGELGKKFGGKEFQEETAKVIPLAMADGKAAIAWVRNHASAYAINPERIGIMGFSAGGTVAASTLFDYNNSNKPNFAAPIYPYFPDQLIGTVTAGSPPLFIAVATDDK